MMLQDNVARARERPTAAWTFFFRNFSVASRLPPASRCATCQPCSWAGAAPVRGRGANDGRAEWRDAGGASREGHGRRRGRPHWRVWQDESGTINQWCIAPPNG